MTPPCAYQVKLVILENMNGELDLKSVCRRRITVANKYRAEENAVIYRYYTGNNPSKIYSSTIHKKSAHRR